jgi:hypothetical protein
MKLKKATRNRGRYSAKDLEAQIQKMAREEYATLGCQIAFIRGALWAFQKKIK